MKKTISLLLALVMLLALGSVAFADGKGNAFEDLKFAGAGLVILPDVAQNERGAGVRFGLHFASFPEEEDWNGR